MYKSAILVTLYDLDNKNAMIGQYSLNDTPNKGELVKCNSYQYEIVEREWEIKGHLQMGANLKVKRVRK